jgi:type III pantothenate kinase
MLLTIDIGNTNTVFALFKGSQILKSWRIVTQSSKSADEYAVFFFGLKNHEGYSETVRDIIISSVVPETNFHITQFCKTYMNIDPVFVTRDLIDLPINIDRPEEVGADRLVNAISVINHYQAPAIVLDFGTATTFDVIGAAGVYEGGVIAPGINLSMSALAQAASKLPKISISKPPASIGKNTADAMKSGLYWGYVGLIEGILQRLCNEMPQDQKPLVVATGGLALTFKDDISSIEIIDNDLTLKGLYSIYQTLKR